MSCWIFISASSFSILLHSFWISPKAVPYNWLHRDRWRMFLNKRGFEMPHSKTTFCSARAKTKCSTRMLWPRALFVLTSRCFRPVTKRKSEKRWAAFLLISLSLSQEMRTRLCLTSRYTVLGHQFERRPKAASESGSRGVLRGWSLHPGRPAECRWFARRKAHFRSRDWTARITQTKGRQNHVCKVSISPLSLWKGKCIWESISNK